MSKKPPAAPAAPTAPAALADPPPPNVAVLLVLRGHAACFVTKAAATGWRRVRLHGEDWLPLPDLPSASAPIGIDAALAQLQEHLNLQTRLATCAVHVVRDQASLPLLAGLPAALAARGCAHWQVLQWQPLRQRAERVSGASGESGEPGSDWPAAAWLTATVLPLLQAAFDYHDEALAAERRRSQAQHEESMQTLRAERNRLQAECDQLQAQIAATRRMELDELTAFLPALYRNVFSEITAHDLALLAGTVQRVPAIASPWSEPSRETLRALQTRVRNLPAAQAQALRQFCHQLPHRLEARPEMRRWLEGHPQAHEPMEF